MITLHLRKGFCTWAPSVISSDPIYVLTWKQVRECRGREVRDVCVCFVLFLLQVKGLMCVCVCVCCSRCR
uniref:Uncharacterized protein n=1 Tax=Anguilla anguilla TaxID=7936 RepID=A0A0E9SE82_ANGAN